jgi:hypothetical protein
MMRAEWTHWAMVVVFEYTALAYSTMMCSLSIELVLAVLNPNNVAYLRLLLTALSAFGYCGSCDDEFVRPPYTGQLPVPRCLFGGP